MQPQTRPKAYSYLRFSTPEQIKGDSRRRQSDAAAEYAAKHKLDLDSSLKFEDLGVSAFKGANSRSGALQRFLELAETGDIPKGSYLLVENLDRITRENIIDAQSLFLRLITAGLTVVTLQDGHEFSRASILANQTGLLMSILTMMRAHEESETKSKRIAASWKNKRANAATRPLTAWCPQWMRLNKSANRYELIEERAKIVRRIVSMTLDGKGQHQITAALNLEGEPPFGRAALWNRSYVKKIIESPALIGTLVPHRFNDDGVREPLEPLPNYYPAVIGQDAYDDLCAMREGRRAPTIKGRAPPQHLLAGLAKCPLCGGTMTRVNKGAGNGAPRLVCSAAKAKAACRLVPVKLGQVEQAILDNAAALVGEAPTGDAGLDADLERAFAALDGLDQLISSATDELLRVKSAAIRKRLEELEAARAASQELLDDLLRRADSATQKVVQRRLAGLLGALEASPINNGKANAALRQCVQHVIVDWRSGSLGFHWTHGGETSLQFAWPKDVATAA